MSCTSSNEQRESEAVVQGKESSEQEEEQEEDQQQEDNSADADADEKKGAIKKPKKKARKKSVDSSAKKQRKPREVIPGDKFFVEDEQMVIPLLQDRSYKGSRKNNNWNKICRLIKRSIACPRILRPTVCRLSDVRAVGANPCEAQKKVIQTICDKRNIFYRLENIRCQRKALDK